MSSIPLSVTEKCNDWDEDWHSRKTASGGGRGEGGRNTTCIGLCATIVWQLCFHLTPPNLISLHYTSPPPPPPPPPHTRLTPPPPPPPPLVLSPLTSFPLHPTKTLSTPSPNSHPRHPPSSTSTTTPTS
ncbi:unnamed protein product [Hydatigera taeniaeformis]|uniref:Uncharacterized protein n=1 Tax=Hydatigena taeniaeformis TaxID=6205 RepID=A0A0R3WKD4_HYDTA|nr:unnamed protein product [Hydatigera taeniaeformis]